ncbi:MAG: bsaAI [Bacteroidetes bacterium]|nr:bsaAI [Bacteroidota bacterium]
MLLLDEAGLKLWAELKDRTREKQPFSPFQNGGIEVKATCGSVPTPAECARKGVLKPDIGDQRIDVLKGYDWKAHHRDTNNLMGILWDFINGVPRIVAVFFANNLLVEDWGAIVQPKEGGGRTTSVSIMTRKGVKKMYDGCLYVINEDRYINFLNRYNDSALL